jgi:hypothetical protein
MMKRNNNTNSIETGHRTVAQTINGTRRRKSERTAIRTPPNHQETTATTTTTTTHDSLDQRGDLPVRVQVLDASEVHAGRRDDGHLVL